MTPLRQRMMEDMQIRNFSPNTIGSYVFQVAQFAKHFKKSRDLLGTSEAREYHLFLLKERKIAYSSLKQTVAALKNRYAASRQGSRKAAKTRRTTPCEPSASSRLWPGRLWREKTESGLWPQSDRCAHWIFIVSGCTKFMKDCPVCKKGRMVELETIKPEPVWSLGPSSFLAYDTW